MLRINVHEAKTHLSRYLEQVAQGEVITICRNNLPIAELRGLPAARTKQRKLGRHKGQVVVHPSFYEPLDDADLDRWDAPGG